MAFFIITGKTDCLNTTHAIHVADHLSQTLPHFKYRAILKSEMEWPEWLDEINSENNWHETKSPVIWKEISRMGGKPYRIGGLGEFWEYCYDYYGYHSKMTTEDLKKIMADNSLLAQYSPEKKIQNISVIGAGNYKTLQFIIYEIQKCFNDYDNMVIKLFDDSANDDLDEEDFLLEMLENLKDYAAITPQSLSVVLSQEDVLKDCDLLVVIKDYGRISGEDVDSWLERCRQEMLLLSDDINQYAKRSLRVILNHQGPVCFNASVLMEYCTRIRLANIVAITTDEGLSLISHMAKKIDELVENFWCPPVWGFSGLLSYVDLSSTFITTEIIRPFKRALRTKESTKLPKGKYQHEIRLLENVLKISDELLEEIEEKKEKEEEVLGSQPILPKIRAFASLMKLWFAETISDDIISLGVCSNGSFGFPSGVCFSQPVILNEKRVWEPISIFPLNHTTVTRISEICLQVENTLKKFGLEEKITHQN